MEKFGKNFLRFIVVTLTALSSSAFAATNDYIPFQGIITNSSDAPIISTAVTLEFHFFGGATNCEMYVLSYSPTTDGKGLVSLNLGDATGPGYLVVGNPGGILFKQIFDNNSRTYSCLTGGPYTSAAGDDRKVSIWVNGVNPLSYVSIGSVPFAMVAESATKSLDTDAIKGYPLSIAAPANGHVLTYNAGNWINQALTFGTGAGQYMQGNQTLGGDVTGGVGATNLAKIQGYTVDLSTAPGNGQVLTYSTGTNKWTAQNPAAAGVTGSGTQYFIPAFNNAGGTAVGNSLIQQDATSTYVGIGGAPGAFKLDVLGNVRIQGSLDMTSFATNKITNLMDPSATHEAATWDYVNAASSAAASNRLRIDGTNSPSADIPWNSKKITNLADPTAAQDAATKNYVDTGLAGKQNSLGYTPVNKAGELSVGTLEQAAQKNFKIGYYSTAQESTLIATPLLAADAGRIWYNTSTNQIKYWDGSAAQSLGAAGGGITSFNGSAQSSQSLAVPGTTGTAPNWSTNAGTGVHTLNIPMANTAGTSAGLISKTEYDQATGRGFTSGSVIFSTGVGGNSQDNTNFFWDNGSKRLGIGTSSPSHSLHIGSAGGQMRLPSGGDATTPTLIFDDYNTGIYQTSAATHDIAFTANGTEIMRLLPSGNVGVGTATPGSKLDVKGALRLSGSTSGYAGFQPAANAGATVWTLPTADGAGGQFLTTNGGGILSWSSPTGTLSGLTTGQVGVASGPSSMSGNSGFTFNSSTGLQLSVTHPVDSSNSNLTIYPTFSMSGAGSNLVMSGQNIQTTITVSGVNATNSVLGQKIFNQRMSDAGTLGKLAGQQIYYGHGFGVTGTSTDVYGAIITPNFQSGTITNSYSLYLDNPSLSTAPPTNRYGVFQIDPQSINYFAGNTDFAGNIEVGSAPATLQTLSAGVAGGSTSIPVASTASYPSKGVIIIDREAIYYSGKTGTAFNNLTRGYMGTTAAAHALGAPVNMLNLSVAGGGAAPTAAINATSQLGLGTVAPTARIAVNAPTGIASAGALGTFVGNSIQLSNDDTTAGKIVGEIHFGGRLNNPSSNYNHIPIASISGVLQTDASGGQVGDLVISTHDALLNASLSEKMRFVYGGPIKVNSMMVPNGDNSYSLGNSGNRWTDVWAANGIIQTSDRRAKENIVENKLGLDFVSKLEPVSYNWKKDSEKHPHFGFIAQDVDKLLKFNGVEDSAIVYHDSENDTWGMNYSELISPIVRAIQQLYARFQISEAQTNGEIQHLKAENAELKERLDRLEKRFGSP